MSPEDTNGTCTSLATGTRRVSRAAAEVETVDIAVCVSRGKSRWPRARRNKGCILPTPRHTTTSSTVLLLDGLQWSENEGGWCRSQHPHSTAFGQCSAERGENGGRGEKARDRLDADLAGWGMEGVQRSKSSKGCARPPAFQLTSLLLFLPGWSTA